MIISSLRTTPQESRKNVIRIMDTQLTRARDIIASHRKSGDEYIISDFVDTYQNELSKYLDTDMNWMDDHELAYAIFDESKLKDKISPYLRNCLQSRGVFRHKMVGLGAVADAKNGNNKHRIFRPHMNIFNDFPWVIPHEDDPIWREVLMYLERSRSLGVNDPSVTITVSVKKNKRERNTVSEYILYSSQVGDWSLWDDNDPGNAICVAEGDFFKGTSYLFDRYF